METINIFGAEYTLENDDPGLSKKHRRGEVDLENKIMRFKSTQGLLEENDMYRDKKACKRNTIRHEVIHAALYELGFKEFCYNEELVEALTNAFPEIQELVMNVENAEYYCNRIIKCLTEKYLDNFRYMFVNENGTIYFYRENPGFIGCQNNKGEKVSDISDSALVYLGRNQNDMDNKASLIKDRMSEIKFYN